MGSQNKLQPYKYSMKTVAAGELSSICRNRFMMYMIPPKDALSIERLFCHFVMTFDSGIAAADRKIESIGIVDELHPFPITADANYQRRQTVNLQADANRRVDLSMDLTHLLNHNNVAYEESVLDPGAVSTGYTAVEIKLPDSLVDTSNVGVLVLWKIDGLFTTTGIR
jgi:hypothetical protein